jgi:hypothetical protein
MLLNFFYCIFFGGLDLIIYSLLTGLFKVPKHVIISIIGLTIAVTLLHTGIFKIDSIMSWKHFGRLLTFSFGFIILYFGSKLQDVSFESKQNTLNQKLYLRFKTVFDFIRYKLIYIMLFIYQFLAIWNESIR